MAKVMLSQHAVGDIENFKLEICSSSFRVQSTNKLSALCQFLDQDLYKNDPLCAKMIPL